MSKPFSVANGLGGRGPTNLNKMPTEMLLNIYKNCPSLSAVWALANTSRRLSGVFDAHAAIIVETVLQSTVPDETVCLMKAVVQIRTGALDVVKASKLNDIAESFAGATARRTKEVSQIRNGTFNAAEASKLNDTAESISDALLSNLSSQPLSHNVPPPLLRKFVGLVHQLRAIARLGIMSGLQGLASRMGTSVGIPSWLTEQRAIISFWRMQFFFELKNRHRNDDRLTFDPRELDLLPLRPFNYLGPPFSFDTLDSFFTHGWVREQVLTVAHFVDDLSVANTPHELSSSEAVGSRSSAHYSFPSLETINITGWGCETAGDGDQAHRILRPPTCFRILNCFSRYQENDEDGLWTLPHQPYRKLGLFLCEAEMLVRLGLFPAGTSTEWETSDYAPWQTFLHDDEECDYYDIWKRLLTEEEVEEAKEARPAPILSISEGDIVRVLLEGQLAQDAEMARILEEAQEGEDAL